MRKLVSFFLHCKMPPEGFHPYNLARMYNFDKSRLG